jgi:hypothetical protein
MPTIYLDRAFVFTALVSAHELYRYVRRVNATSEEEMACAECLGTCWGNYNEADDTFIVMYAGITQLVEHRDETCVIGPEPFGHAIHSAWAGLDLGDANRLGTFHSHPWTQEEINTDGLSDADRWTSSPADRSSMGDGEIEIIISIRPRTSVSREDDVWAHRGDIVSGRHDENHVTISGWLKRGDSVVQARVSVPDVARINRTIERLDSA